MKLIITLSIAVLLFSCNDAKQENATNSTTDNTAMIETTQKNSSAAVQIILDGTLYEIEQDSLRNDMVTFENKLILFYLRAKDYPENPVRLNFNLHNTGILEKGSATYNIPETKPDTGELVELDFWDHKHKGDAVHSRVIFKKGEIQITQLTKNKLVMSFSGEGNGTLSRTANFPVSGKVNISY